MELTDKELAKWKNEALTISSPNLNLRLLRCIAEIEALRQAEPFTVKVEIPPLDENGHCNEHCPFHCAGEPCIYCTQNWLDEKLSGDDEHWGTFYAHPNPGCPRYKEGK